MRFWSNFVDASAAWPEAVEGATKLPDLFSRMAIGIFWLLAYPYSTYPIEPGVVLILAVTPSFPLDLVPTGQLGILLVPGFWANSLLTALRCLEKTNDVPLLSARTTTLIGVAGSCTPGFVAAIKGSFHVVTLPRKMPAYAFRESFSSLTPSRL